MSSSYYSDDDEDIDVHIRRRGASPHAAHYVDPRPRPRSYYPQGPAYLTSERTIVRARSRSHERRSTPPAAHQAPVIINKIYNDLSSDEDERRLQVSRKHRVSHSRSSSSGMTREDYDLQRAREELEQFKIRQQCEKEEQRREKELKEEAELKAAKKELDAIKQRQAQAEEEARIKHQMELERLQEEDRNEQERKRRDKEIKQAIAKFQQEEHERLEKEKEERAEIEREYQRRMQEHLINSGLDEKSIQAILKKEKIPESKPEALLESSSRPTYTRMARKHLSIETLRKYHVEYELDEDPDYFLIKRWVPEWEQDELWEHTKRVRDKRRKLLLAVDEPKSHHHHRSRSLEPEFEWVRKKERKRSKSPLLMYLAGARPA